jgi:metal-responsive CopG/Arc/MetJ family transcriptional regulator
MAPFWRHNKDMDEEHRINLRLPKETYDAIDRLRKLEPGKISRNTWIASAIEEKIEKSNQELAKREDHKHA